jgi:hypothetical protein
MNACKLHNLRTSLMIIYDNDLFLSFHETKQILPQSSSSWCQKVRASVKAESRLGTNHTAINKVNLNHAYLYLVYNPCERVGLIISFMKRLKVGRHPYFDELV